MAEWVTEDRIIEAARLVAPEHHAEELAGIFRHMVKPVLHADHCFVAQEARAMPATLMSSNDTAGIMPVCFVCEAFYTQLMPMSLGNEFLFNHVKSAHPNEFGLWQLDLPWFRGDPTWN